ncbi:MAG TPA: peptidase domain-containing ABC transporter [Paludibacter sp.]|nr:peptidase domain-containing ABC transporter [Paludibacter sp.]
MIFKEFLQHDAMDCGPTCLRMVAAHYGRVFSLEGLREKSLITREGVSMLGISEAAEHIGFRTTGVRVSFEELLTAPLPCIVHWNQQHFVVVYDIKTPISRFQLYPSPQGEGSGVRSRRAGSELVYVADPAAGKLKYTREEFCRCWLSSRDEGEDVGVALLLEPSPGFYEQEDEKTNRKGFSFLFSYLRPYKKLIVQLFLGLLFGSLLQLILPFLTQSIVDFGISEQNIGYIYLVLIAQLVLTFSNSVVGFIRGWILLHLGTRINIALISDFLIKMMRLPMGYFDTKMVGDILQRIHDHTRIQNYLTNSSLSILFSVFNIFIFSIVLLLYSFTIFAIFFVGSTLYFGWVWLFMKRRAELDHKSFAQHSANQSNVIQLVTGMPEIKLNGCEQQKRWEWERIQAKLFRLQIRGLALAQYQDSGAVLVNQTKNIIITALVAKLVIDGQMTLGMMMAVQYIIGQLNSPVDQLIAFSRETQDAKLSLERLSEVHDKEDEEAKDEQRIREIPTHKDIRLQNVTFGYNATSVGEPVVKNINLSIPFGKQTAIVGTSGSGKTTLVKLLLEFYPLQKGDILLGENNLKNYSIREWRKQCGVVMQDGFIFSDSIAKNIAPGVETIDKERLLNAVITANIREFIESLPLSYNTKIGNEGHGLSQGQKQRILIARAVYKNPAFVFLDEATNALDTNNERVIMDNLQAFFKGRTSVVIAHRLSTVKNADQIVVLEKGEIVEIGTHQELTKLEGAYYRLVKNQLEL